MSRLVRFLPLALLSTSGCFSSCLDRDEQDTGWEDPEPSRRAVAPSVDAISIADWPPVGPEGRITVTVSDDEALEEVKFTFADTVRRPIGGRHRDVGVTGSELGEGYGTLWVDVFDAGRRFASRAATGVLVDLTPPTADFLRTTARAIGEGEGTALEVWVGDAWLLGSVSLSFNGVTKKHTFPERYPPTLGEVWDHSFEVFPAADFPPGRGTAHLRVTDAAGNAMERTFEVLIDDSAPTVAIASPLDGSAQGGVFSVELEAEDGEGPTRVELFAGGALVATAVGPDAVVWLDGADFSPGTIEIEAIAYDEAGNASDPARISVVLE